MKDSVRDGAKAEIAQAIQDGSPPYISHPTAMDMADGVIDALKSHGLTIEADWNRDMESAPMAEVGAAWDEIVHFMAYWPDYEEDGETWCAHYAETWYVPSSRRFVCYSLLDGHYVPKKWQPTAWRPITPPQEVET